LSVQCRGVAEGQDFSIPSALAVRSPHAITFLDLGITELTCVKVTAAMLLAFPALPRSHDFTASTLDDTETMTPDHGAARSPNASEEPPSIDLQPQPSRTVAQTFLKSITFSSHSPHVKTIKSERTKKEDSHTERNVRSMRKRRRTGNLSVRGTEFRLP